MLGVMGWKKLKQKLFNGVAYVSLGLMGTTFASISLNTCAYSAAYVSNNVLDHDKKTIAVANGHNSNLSKEYGAFGSYVAYFFMYAPVTFKENLMGNKVDWHVNTSRKETLDTLLKKDYENLVLIGHGTKGAYMVKNGKVNSFDLFNLRIKGKLFKYTCGSEDGISFADVILEDSENNFSYNERISVLTIYSDAWKKLFD